MCVIISQNEGQIFNKEDFIYAAGINKHGIGIAVWEKENTAIEDSPVVLKVGRTLPETAEQAWNYYDTYASGKKALIHLRYRTHGEVSIDNCHPFQIISQSEGFKQDLFLMHNGILSGQVCSGQDSDTLSFCKDIRKFIEKRKYVAVNLDEQTHKAIEKKAGKHNRIVLFDGKGGTLFTGSWVDYKGFKCSNNNYFPYQSNFKSNDTSSYYRKPLPYYGKPSGSTYTYDKPVSERAPLYNGWSTEQIKSLPLEMLNWFQTTTLARLGFEQPDVTGELLKSLITELYYLRSNYTFEQEEKAETMLRPVTAKEWSALIKKNKEKALAVPVAAVVEDTQKERFCGRH